MYVLAGLCSFTEAFLCLFIATLAQIMVLDEKHSTEIPMIP